MSYREIKKNESSRSRGRLQSFCEREPQTQLKVLIFFPEEKIRERCQVWIFYPMADTEKKNTRLNSYNSQALFRIQHSHSRHFQPGICHDFRSLILQTSIPLRLNDRDIPNDIPNNVVSHTFKLVRLLSFRYGIDAVAHILDFASCATFMRSPN